VADVPAKLARRVRLLSNGHGRKTDQADALSVGIAAHTATRLNTAVVDEAIAALRALTEHRDDLVRTGTQTINRLHALLTQLIPAGLPRGLCAGTAAAALRSIRPRAVLARTCARSPRTYSARSQATPRRRRLPHHDLRHETSLPPTP
jgi:transposase